jgi:AcrR family transcriptional regulator
VCALDEHFSSRHEFLELEFYFSVDADRAERPRREAGTQTRRKLLEMGRRAFARKGHAGANLRDDILVPAGVSVGSFYHQFRDKTDLFLEILREHSEMFLATLHRTHTPPPRDVSTPGEVARESFATCFRIAEENEDVFHIILRERESDDARVRRYLQENRRHWIASLAADYRRLMGSADRDVTELAAELISALTFGTLLSYLDLPMAERKARRARLIDGLAQFTLGGVGGLLTAAPSTSSTRALAAPRRYRRGKGGH